MSPSFTLGQVADSAFSVLLFAAYLNGRALLLCDDLLHGESRSALLASTGRQPDAVSVQEGHAVTDVVRLYEVLLVEDDPGDVALISEAFAAHRLPSRLHTAGDGVDALTFLRREQPHADAPRPDLILLDLNMPRMDGRELLSVVKNDPDLCSIPVVVFTTSDLPADVSTSYTRHANAYITKPMDLDALEHAVDTVHTFYREVARRPT